MRIFSDVFVKAADIFRAEYQPERVNVRLITAFKILFPVKRDVTAFNNQVLLIFNRRFNDFPGNIPKVRRQFALIAFGRQRTDPAPDTANFLPTWQEVKSDRFP